MSKIDETIRRQREVFADRYKANPALADYAALMNGSADDGKDQADLPADHPDSFQYKGA